MRILIVDHQPIFVEGLRLILSKVPWIYAIKALSNGLDINILLVNENFDLVIIDIESLDCDMLTIERIKAINHQCKILVLTNSQNIQTATILVDHGVSGYLLKNDPVNMLIDAIRSIKEGNLYVTKTISNAMLSSLLSRGKSDYESNLTKREQQVFLLLAQGQSNKEIALSLGIEIGTVKNYLSKIYDKLDVTSRLEAMRLAWDLGLSIKGSRDLFSNSNAERNSGVN